MTKNQETARKYDIQNHSNPAYVKALRAAIEENRKKEREKECIKSWMFS
jgi:hypothetical protein